MDPSGKSKGPPPAVKKVLSLFGSGREEDRMVGYLSFLKIGPKLLKFLPGAALPCLWSCPEQLERNAHFQKTPSLMTKFPAWLLQSHLGEMTGGESASLTLLSTSSMSKQF